MITVAARLAIHASISDASRSPSARSARSACGLWLALYPPASGLWDGSQAGRPPPSLDLFRAVALSESIAIGQRLSTAQAAGWTPRPPSDQAELVIQTRRRSLTLRLLGRRDRSIQLMDLRARDERRRRGPLVSVPLAAGKALANLGQHPHEVEHHQDQTDDQQRNPPVRAAKSVGVWRSCQQA